MVKITKKKSFDWYSLRVPQTKSLYVIINKLECIVFLFKGSRLMVSSELVKYI